jgi:pyruvate kinase
VIASTLNRVWPYHAVMNVCRTTPATSSAQALLRAVGELYVSARQSCEALLREEDYASDDALASARNFAAYLGVRRSDIRELQRDLHRVGLSSLGRIETHALNSLESVCGILARLCGRTPETPETPETPDPRAVAYDAGEEILARRTGALLGPKPPGRSSRIMVTLPTEAAEHYELVRDLIAAGMGVARINGAHDAAEHWLAMAQHARRAARELERPCTILCDLPGPKLRTGSMKSGPGVVRWHAFKNAYGDVIEPARVWLSTGASPPSLAHAALPVNAEFIAQLRPGDEVHFRDYQDRNRWITVVDVTSGGVWVEAARGAFMVEGIQLTARRGGQDLPIAGLVNALRAMPGEVLIRTGDAILLTPGDDLSRPAQRDARGNRTAPARICCTLPEIFRDARIGDRVFIDDGKIAAVIEAVDAEGIWLRTTWTRSNPERLGEDKGINFPDTPLSLPAPTAGDVGVLDFVASYSDLIDSVGLSFVRRAEDVDALQRAMDSRGLRAGVVLKIETATAFRNLPGIILSGLRRDRVGVMIARGDLGVEVGFERMAELQEEIASLCAAAHLPVVWATQVLDNLAKKGMPSRAEVSDVVLAARTQCVMLNKGPHVITAVRFLVDVLERMEGHQDKHFRLLRALRVAQV